MSQPVLSSKCIAYFEDPETKNSCTPSCPIMELDDEFVFNFRPVENHIGKRKKERQKEEQEIFYFVEFFKPTFLCFCVKIVVLKIFEKNLQFQIGKWWSIFIDGNFSFYV